MSEEEIGRRLQARVPGFHLSPDPGGKWNWLLGLVALGVATSTLVVIARGTVRARRPAQIELETNGAKLREEEEELQDRLDDELRDFG